MSFAGCGESAFANPGAEVDTASLQAHLPEVAGLARAALSKARDTLLTEDQPYIRIAAVLTGGGE